MSLSQFAIYRVDLNTDGMRIQGHSYQYIKDHKLDLCINNYRQIYQAEMQEKETVRDVANRIRKAVGNPTLDSVGTSDVLVLNRAGVVDCYYIDKDRYIALRNFIRSTNGGNVISFDTKGYEIEGKAGTWDSIDTLIIDGNIYYLMENQKFRDDAENVILDAYGKMIADDIKGGFDDIAKQKIRDSIKPETEKKEPEVQQTERMLLWQKYLQNGTWERRSESGTEANYDMVDGRVNNLPEETKPIIQSGNKKKSKKRVSVIGRLHQKQIDIARRSGKPIPMYLQAMERNRK